MAFNKFITNASDLVTTHQATRTGFLSIALEKNRISDPYVKTALSFKTMVTGVKKPDDLLTMSSIRPFLLSASGLSDKSLNYLDEDDRTEAIKELIDKFLKPAGSDFVDEVVYRYLLIKYACYNKVYIISNWSLEKQYAEVQREDKESWEAFLRRIHKVVVYSKDGSIEEYDSVKAYLNRDEYIEIDDDVDSPFA